MDDPYDWTIDQVIASVAPEDPPLAESLRSNEVDGEVLLTVCTYERLKDDIGILPLGKRSKIMRVIEGLRKRSEKYMDHILDLASNTALPDDVGYSPRAIRSLDIPELAAPNLRKRKSSVLGGPFTTPIYSSPPLQPQDLPLRVSATPELLPPVEVRKKRIKPLSLLASADENLPLFVPESALHFANHSAVRIVRNRETGMGDTVPFELERVGSESPSVGGMDVDVDVGGHYSVPSPGPDGVVGNGDDNREVGTPMVMPREASVVGDGVQEHREGGRSSSHIPEVETPSKVNFGGSRKTRKRQYLPVKGLPVDELIYGKTEVGEEIHSEEGGDEFCMVPTTKPPGQRHYVARQIRHLLNAPSSITLTHKGHLRTALKPYREDLVLKHHHQAFTLFTVRAGGVCTATRENTASVPLPWSTTRGTQTSSSDIQVVRFADAPERPQPQLSAEDNSLHDWDYLTKWQNTEDADAELPAFGESGSEGEYSIGTWAEIEAEHGWQERPLGRGREPLTPEVVKSVLAEGERGIVERWRERVLPRKESGAWRVYRRAKRARERKKTARDARVRIGELEERLVRMRGEVEKVGWTRVGDLRKQVKILAPSLQEREEMRWVIALMERKKTPERPERRVQVEGVEEEEEEGEEIEDDDDGESLGSTSEEGEEEEEEGMDGFIVPDTERDVVNGVEVEVEGEKEVEEELARKAAENELIDSDNGSEDDAPMRLRYEREHNKGKGPEQQVQAEEEPEDQPMTGMDDDEPGTEPEEETVVTPRQDKGKGKAQPDSPPPIVKEEPVPLQVIRSLTSKKDIPVIDLTMEDSPQGSDERDVPRKPLKEIPHIDLSWDEGNGPKAGELYLEILVKKTDEVIRTNIYYRVEDVPPTELFKIITAFARQLGEKKITGVPGLDKYEHLRGSISKDAYRLILDELRNGTKVYQPIAKYYVAWALEKPNIKKLTPEQWKVVNNEERFMKFRAALMRKLKDYVDTTPLQVARGAEPSTPKNGSKGKKLGRKVTFEEEISEEEIESTPTGSGHRRRPRKEVVEDATAKAKRELLQKKMNNLARRAKDEERRGKLSGVENGVGKIRINIGKYAKDNDIFFHPSLASQLKPHQVEGIRFMWQQLVQTGENRGALLAHTMGLGKTLQVIALLYTLATAAKSPDKKTWGQIPEHLRVSKTLVLSPPGLVENWWDEFRKWLPSKPGSETDELDLENIGEIIRADGTVGVPERLRNIQRWYNDGGVLLMGYQTFRTLVLNPKILSSEDEHSKIKDMLLNGPNIIIADEAHQLKNPLAKISEATRHFRSMSRIAMTGSPLSNNLLEYWSMIDWIDPYFLGPRKEFEQKYVQPINDGLYADSSEPEKRKCLKMLRVLKNDIGPKVHRMDISVIQKDLPPKTEFLIKVPLTALQLEMYRRFLRDPTTTGRMGDVVGEATAGRRFFDVIHLMSLICNHPLCFVETLEAREKGNQEARVRPPVPRRPSGVICLDDELEDLEDSDGVGTKFMDDLLSETNQPYPWAREVMNTVPDELSLDHSYKMMLVKNIIECTIKAGDQLLLFTHSVLTLSFLERHLNRWCFRYQKLDGKTPMNTRQAITKKFNSGTGGSVCLISTEAGGLGLNLPGANRIIIFDFKWSPMWEEQAVGRGFRLGQKKHVFVYRFHACGTYEEIMRNKVLFKNQLHSRVVDKRDPIRYATKNGKQYFAEPFDVPPQSLEEMIGKDPQVLDHIIKKVDYIRSIENTETFQRDDEADALTEEEIRETEEMLKAEKEGRKAQGQQNDAARKADEEYRKLNTGKLRLAENTDFAKQVELQLEQERVLAERMRLLDQASTASLAAPSTKPTVPSPQAPVTPRPQAAANLPPKSMGRIKTVPKMTPNAAGKDQDVPPKSAPPAIRTAVVGPNSKPELPLSVQPVQTPPPTKNKFGLDVTQGLPSVHVFTRNRGRTDKDNSEKSSGGPDGDSGKKAKEVTPVGTLTLRG